MTLKSVESHPVMHGDFGRIPYGASGGAPLTVPPATREKKLRRRRGLTRTWATVPAEDHLFWGVDSEFLTNPDAASRGGDIMSIQFACCRSRNDDVIRNTASSNLSNSWFFDNADAFKEFMRSKWRSLSTIVYAFVVCPEIGCMQAWLDKWRPGQHVTDVSRMGVQHRAWIQYTSTEFIVVDMMPILYNFVFHRLEDLHKICGLHKKTKPNWLGKRRWRDQYEFDDFKDYSMTDAEITARAAAWLVQEQRVDPVKYMSAGTIAKDYFNFPQRLTKLPGNAGYEVPYIESLIDQTTSAGRSECFLNGFIQDVTYHDVQSLYPLSIVATRCLQIDGVTDVPDFEWSSYERSIPDAFTLPSEMDGSTIPLYGWIRGSFFVDPEKQDKWGLAQRGEERNYYCVGRIHGTFSTFDLCAAHAKPLAIEKVWRPIYSDQALASHNKYCETLEHKLDPGTTIEQAYKLKAVLNAASGKLCQSHPTASATSNYPAYSMLIGYSHLIMSRLFDRYDSEIISIDTDSILGRKKMLGQQDEVTDGEQSFAVNLKDKGHGNVASFRSKQYVLWDESLGYVPGVNPKYAAHGWDFFTDHFKRLYWGKITYLNTGREVKHTLLTNHDDAKWLPLGHWYYEPAILTLKTISERVRCDSKRVRENDDSYGLVIQRKCAGSKARNYQEELLVVRPRNLGKRAIDLHSHSTS